ncbi:hypothetical protein THRCLA_20245 [Thraustotheca clavata]|uniref:Uncharacterized protein n=1 Tax=Thraustotheca clavata TaxID=74557 RepID=A0A1W0AAE0_9STRA|nr:hypothetical protein THRCLA_20245 [Thraustotheca clavata]
MDDAYYCLYKTAKCRNVRGVKRDGTLHRMCNEHRAKANESQRKSEAKKRFRKFVSKRHFPVHRQGPWTMKHESNDGCDRMLEEACERMDPGCPWTMAEDARASLTTQEEEEDCNDHDHTPIVPKMALGFILDN